MEVSKDACCLHVAVVDQLKVDGICFNSYFISSVSSYHVCFIWKVKNCHTESDQIKAKCYLVFQPQVFVRDTMYMYASIRATTL